MPSCSSDPDRASDWGGNGPFRFLFEGQDSRALSSDEPGDFRLFFATPHPHSSRYGTIPGFAVGLGAAMLVGVAELAAGASRPMSATEYSRMENR